jgi:hypothetical protein
MARGWPALDSDEAIVGLMARHILYAGEHPIFYYGQHYMGPLEAYLTAGIFRVVGPGVVGLRLGTLALTLGFLICMYLLGRAAYGRAVGLLTLALLAVGPAFGLLREQPAIGGYQETLLFAALIPLLVYCLLRRPAVSWSASRSTWLRRLATYGLIGLLAGLGIWSDTLVLPFVIASLAALACARPREVFGLPLAALGALAAGVFIGGAPFWVYNLTHNGQTFSELSQANVVPGSSGLFPGWHAWGQQLASTLTIGLPALFGSPHVCVAPGAVYAGYTSYPAAAVSMLPGAACATFNGAFSILILIVLVVAGWQLAHAMVPVVRMWLASAGPHREARESPVVGQAPEAQHAALWLRAVLLVSAVATLLLYSLSHRTVTTDQFVVVRYLLPAYVALPVLVGCLWEYAAPLWGLIRVWFPRSRGGGTGWQGRQLFGSAGAALFLCLLALFFLLGAVEAITTAASATYALPQNPKDARLIQELDGLGLTRYYADYWTCYNLVFESGERLHCSTLGRTERYPPYAALLAATAHPAYVLYAESSQDRNFVSYIASQGHPHDGYSRVLFEGYAIYYVPGGQER